MLKTKGFMLILAVTLMMAPGLPSPTFADGSADLPAKSEEIDKTAQANETPPKVITVGEYRRKNLPINKKNAARDVNTDANEDTDENPETNSGGTTQEANNSASELTSLGVFRTTAYCPCRSCSSGYGRRTSTGTIAQANHTIAVDPRVIPYGSKIMINGTIYTAEDCGGGVKGKHIDIYFDSHAQARRYGSRQIEVFLLP